MKLHILQASNHDHYYCGSPRSELSMYISARALATAVQLELPLCEFCVESLLFLVKGAVSLRDSVCIYKNESIKSLSLVTSVVVDEVYLKKAQS